MARKRRLAPEPQKEWLEQSGPLKDWTMRFRDALLHSILENFPSPFFMVDQDLVVIHMNERMEELTGYTREEVVGKMSCGSVLNTEQCFTGDCVLKQVMAQKMPVSGLRRVVRNRHGREIPVVVYASVITDQDGRVIGGFEAIRDISERVEGERKIELLTELTREGILMVDEGLKVLLCNSRLAQLVDRPRQELIGLELAQAVSPQHQRVAAKLLKQKRQQETQFISTLNTREAADQERRVFETTMGISRVGGQRLICIYLRDLTQRIKIGRELNKANTFLANIINRSVDGIVVLDPKGVPLIFNEGAERILGFRAEEIIGQPEAVFRFYPQEVAKEMMRRMRSDSYGPPDKLNTTQITFYDKSGHEVPVNFSAVIIREGGREIASVGIFSDLREQVRMRKELEDTQAQLMQAEKIASLGRLAAGVAHEINNPLAGILIYAELLERQLQSGIIDREHIAEIIAQTLRCQQIVNRLLEFSRQSLGQRTHFNVNDILKRCLDLLTHHARFMDIEVHTHLDPDLPEILGDPGQLQQVFTNLLLNAADALRGQGRITVASSPAPRGEGIVLTFTDTGCGIPSNIRSKIFEPFFTTKPPGKGTGLGLAIVYSVIQRHGGTIEVDAAAGGGTTFTIRLPLESQPEAAHFDFL